MRFGCLYKKGMVLLLNLNKVVALAKEQGLSNTFLAKKLGRSSASLFVDWRKGKSKPSQNDIAMLAKILNTSIEYLTDQTENKNNPTGISDEVDVQIVQLLERLNDQNKKIALAQLDALITLQENEDK